MNAACFACGREKPDALVVCPSCEVKPISDKDKINSVCLSDTCFGPDKLLKASRFIREKRKLPRFGDKAIAKATEFVNSLAKPEENYTLIDVDDSFFDFDGFDSDKGESVTVHSIGKPPTDPDGNEPDPIGLAGKGNTYHTIQWELGKDISFEDAETRGGKGGELYIQWTWRGDQGWVWKHVTKQQFDQVKMLEDLSQ
jgi:hypothetical protein